MIKQIICSSCGITLEVPQRNGEPFRVFHCPNCSHQLRATFSHPQPDVYAETAYGGSKPTNSHDKKDEEASTEYLHPKSERLGAIRCETETYPLHLGRNLVGRKSKSSNADVQIPVNDQQMSREHAIISITRIADGSIKALIRNAKEYVTTIADGILLEADDVVVLTNGANLMLGQTPMTYIEE